VLATALSAPQPESDVDTYSYHGHRMTRRTSLSCCRFLRHSGPGFPSSDVPRPWSLPGHTIWAEPPQFRHYCLLVLRHVNCALPLKPFDSLFQRIVWHSTANAEVGTSNADIALRNEFERPDGSFGCCEDRLRLHQLTSAFVLFQRF